MFYVGIFAAISFSVAFVFVAAVLVRFTGSLRASRVLFERLLDQVVHATMRWHDITPQGMFAASGVRVETDSIR